MFAFENNTKIDPLLIHYQATPENLREFQEAVTKVKTEEIANFSSALTIAFRDLIDSREMGINTQCNQAVMLVTDGVPER